MARTLATARRPVKRARRAPHAVSSQAPRPLRSCAPRWRWLFSPVLTGHPAHESRCAQRFIPGASVMQRRFQVLLPVALLLAAVAVAPDARAAAEVHKLNLMFSAMPTSIDGGDFRRDLDYLNQTFLESRGLEGLDPISSGWMF